MATNSSSIGQYAEKLAANYLLAIGYEILDANFYNHRGYRFGEVDIIAQDKEGSYVFVEVKARTGRKDAVVPEESITTKKIKKIEKAAHLYLTRKNSLDKNWRIDAISVILDLKQRRAHIKHIKYIHY